MRTGIVCPGSSKTLHESRARISIVACIIVWCGCCFFQGTPAIAQGEQLETHPGTSSGQEAPPSPAKPADQSGQSTAPDKSEAKPKEKKEKRGSIVAAPLPISSPAIGSGITPVLGYIFPFSMKDKVSPPSVVGAAGLITNNGSRGFAVGAQLYLKEGRNRITGGYVHGNIDYNIYGTGVASDLKLPLIQTGHAFFGSVLRRVWHQFFIGPRFFVGESLLTLQASTGVPIPPDVGLQTTLTSVGAVVTRDTSSNRFYPTDGTFFNFASDFFSKGLGSKYSFQSYKTTFSYYRSLSEKQVLASNAFFCATAGEPPFYGNCIYGTNNELRGYTAGKYFTRYMLATQLEYRLQLPLRLGLVVFGGLGGVIPGGSKLLKNSTFLPGGGGGLRFELSKKYHVNLRADIAQGTDGHTFSMGVGEAF
jgi:surface antigen Omp85-like protein